MDQCINNKHVCYWDKHVLLHNVMAWNSPLMWIIMHPIIGQSISLSLCVYAVFWQGNLCSQCINNGTMEETLCCCAMECSAAEGWSGLWPCMPWHPCTQLLKIERCHGCILFTFAFRRYSSVNFALLFVHPFRCLDGCSPLSWPPFDLSSKHRMRMRCKKERLKETNQS